MLVTKSRVGSWRAFVQLGIRIGEHEPEINAALVNYKQTFLSILNCPKSFSFDIKKAASLGQLEIRRICGLSLRPNKWISLCLVLYLETALLDLFRGFILEARAVSVLDSSGSDGRTRSWPRSRLRFPLRPVRSHRYPLL